MRGISLRDRIPNEEIRRRTKVKDIIGKIAVDGPRARLKDERWASKMIK